MSATAAKNSSPVSHSSTQSEISFYSVRVGFPLQHRFKSSGHRGPELRAGLAQNPPSGLPRCKAAPPASPGAATTVARTVERPLQSVVLGLRQVLDELREDLDERCPRPRPLKVAQRCARLDNLGLGHVDVYQIARR